MDITELTMMLESIGPKKTSDEEFNDCAEKSKKLTNLQDDQRLQLYGLFKQSSIGPVNTKRPWSIDMVGCAKWDAWKSYEHFPIESARLAYVYLVSQMMGQEGLLLPSNRPEMGSSEGGMGKDMSMPVANEGAAWNSTDEQLFEAVIDNDIEKVKGLISSFEEANHPLFNSVEAFVNMATKATPAERSSDIVDGTGGSSSAAVVEEDEEIVNVTPLHYAADRGHVEMAQLLVSYGANCEATDSMGDTPCAYAEVCEHAELLEFFATVKR